jgi:hypothetical protein
VPPELSTAVPTVLAVSVSHPCVLLQNWNGSTQIPSRASILAMKKEKGGGYLTSEQLKTIEERTFSIHRLQLVKDLFIFSILSNNSMRSYKNQ